MRSSISDLTTEIGLSDPLSSLCCGPEKLWEICAVAYSPVYFR
eukprot:COSAG01_NODE_33851_length_557_cov_1.152838_1_plen_42_part_10